MYSLTKIFFKIKVILCILCSLQIAFRVDGATAPPTSARSNLNNIYTVAGTGSTGSGGTGGAATAMTLSTPRTAWLNTNGVIYVVETAGNCARYFSYPNGVAGNYAGVCGPTTSFSGDNDPATSGGMNFPIAIAGSSSGVMYISDCHNNRVRMISTSSIITTLMGLGGASSDTGSGACTAATIAHPVGVWVDTLGQIFLTAYDNGYLKKINSANIVSTLAGQYPLLYIC